MLLAREIFHSSMYHFWRKIPIAVVAMCTKIFSQKTSTGTTIKFSRFFVADTDDTHFAVDRRIGSTTNIL